MALFVWLRLTCCSMNRRLRLSICAVSLPDSAADLSVRILLCRVASALVLVLNSCKEASCSLWKAASLLSTSALMVSGETCRLLSTLSVSLSLSLSSFLPLLPWLSLPVSLPESLPSGLL